MSKREFHFQNTKRKCESYQKDFDFGPVNMAGGRLESTRGSSVSLYKGKKILKEKKVGTEGKTKHGITGSPG